MKEMQHNISLKAYNTFGINVNARLYAAFSSIYELETLLAYRAVHKPDLLVLGGGSNILLTKDYEGLVLKNELKGIEVVNEDNDHLYIRAGAGENWNQFVMYCVSRGYAGVENLSLIPGNVGASPMQNIGAYGVEIKDQFHELEAYHIYEHRLIRFSLNDCAFGYRDSVFKNKYKGQFVITSVTYRLNKIPTFNIKYGAIRQELDAMGIQDLSIEAISKAVIHIRTSKLPDPGIIGNAGSFFKNPVIELTKFRSLEKEFPGIPSFPAQDGYIKVPAGWLIEQCGWKGFRKGDAGCYSNQALVLVNYGNATGTEIYALSTDIIKSVDEKFGIELEREVNII
ncbi:MAG TPA: UDP-N-acetylmuramate dehydrogenase [Flavisolibacter sp.]|nr:UDP-N-acetylmuramate dehydrogenase [Flavisolibacter sp.]